MHRSSTYALGGEKEEEKDYGGKKAGTSSSGPSLLTGDGSEGNVSVSEYRYGSGNCVGVEGGSDSNNPWVNSHSATATTATLRSRRQFQRIESGREIGYVYDDEDTTAHSNGYLRDHRPQSETRRRRRSRSAAAGTSKHPLYVDGDGEGDDNDGYSEGYRYHLSPKSPFSSSYSREPSSTPGFADHQTRPSLRRAIGSLEGQKDVETDNGSKGSRRSDEVDVVVHKVMRTDTLAGISLKYNIPLAQLRKANKLWTNDSIHLRDVLHIPLRDVSSPSLLSPNILLSNSNSVPNSKSTSYTDLPETVFTPGVQGGIHKVAISRLSFFPPSGEVNTPTSISSSRSKSNTQQSTSLILTPPTRLKASNPPPAFSLTSLLQGFNNASHEIKSRLSFDSKHSSETGEEGREIEMDPVKNRKKSDENGVAYPILNTSSISQDQQHSPPVIMTSTLPSSSTPRKTVIRSVQLQPSPKMVIPTAREKGKERGRLSLGLQEAALDSDIE